MAYTKQTWADLPSKTTPINAERLTHIEDGIYSAAQTADTAASTAGTAAANVGIVSGRVETLTERVNGLDTAVSNKVDKVAGKGLSTNDYNNTDKGKVDSLGTASTKNSTSVVTQSTDLVESGAVYDAIEASVGFVTTGKNKLWFTLEGLKSTNTVGTWSGNTYSHKGVTFTVNDDGTITANGTVNTSGHANFEIAIPSDLYGDLKYNGARDGTTNKYDTFMWDYQTNARCNQWDGVTSCLSGYADLEEVKIIQGHYTRFICRIFNGFTANNAKFYPMITDASEVNPTYEPYHASVEESLEQKCDNSVIGTVEGANASKAWSVGEHFIKDGQFKEVTQPIASGGAISDSNTVNKPIADCLVSKRTLTSSDNLNDITADGIYFVSTPVPTNTPEGKILGMLIVKKTDSGTATVQIYVNSSSSEGVMYIRSFRGNPATWQPWYKFTGTVVS